ncbi:MAG: hypothetical protein ACI92G_004054, partial [Candidatus Pelagisphaera sp.]
AGTNPFDYFLHKITYYDAQARDQYRLFKRVPSKIKEFDCAP